MADSPYITDGSPRWTAERALNVYELRGGSTGQLTSVLEDLSASAKPVPGDWLDDRLAVMWGMFMASRASADPDAATVWLSEYVRLLEDLPHDIVSQAIDKAIRTSKHGFLPSVGEIRQYADQPAVERQRMVERLTQMVAAYATS